MKQANFIIVAMVLFDTAATKTHPGPAFNTSNA
ncbi:hypothetical protein CLW00_11073 [Mongoliibacter ruber]|uniref:Uncharacterized protein n=1 Tax=Mongoliibacter ruber TaxID=1750599 RepID=A0A2T0WGZ4_9BACT|nr:hypothetical protein CLW00_11073 [Mongoliibacter ruber]